MRPLVLQITAAGSLPEPALFARLDALAALPAAARARFAVQLRDPELPARALLALGARLREATRARGAALVVNDRLDLALALGADGAHLGRCSVSVAEARALLPPGAWISVACHAVADVARAAAEGADAAVLSPIFPSPGKGPAIGLEALRAARGQAPSEAFQLIALGGVDAAGATACFAAGADAVASIRADLTDVLAQRWEREAEGGRIG
jgi:thiamine-phosphate pyrophosphorylase